MKQSNIFYIIALIFMMNFYTSEVKSVNASLSTHIRQDKQVKKFKGEFVRDENGKYFKDDFSITIGARLLTYIKEGETKKFNITHLGNVKLEEFGENIIFRKVYLQSEKINVYISYNKVATYKGVKYYIMIMDNQIMYLL